MSTWTKWYPCEAPVLQGDLKETEERWSTEPSKKSPTLRPNHYRGVCRRCGVTLNGQGRNAIKALAALRNEIKKHNKRANHGS